MTQPISKFVYLLNEDGTVDSICRRCFVTIATAHRKSDLEREESNHVCETYGLKRFQAHNSPTP
jgi:hypothetical protein